MIEKIVTGIVLGKFPFEDENIIKILSEGGNIISLKAKGIDKYESKNRLSLSLFNIVEFEYFSSSNNSNSGRLKRANLITEYLANSELSYSVVQVLRELLLAHDSYNNVIFNLTSKILRSLEKNTYSFQKMWAILILILRLDGYYPIINKCVKCGSNQNIKGFSLYEGGLICNKHGEGEKYKLEPNTLRKIIEMNALKNPYLCKELNLTPNEVMIVKSIYKQFFSNQLGINLYGIDKI